MSRGAVVVGGAVLAGNQLAEASAVTDVRCAALGIGVLTGWDRPAGTMSAAILGAVAGHAETVAGHVAADVIGNRAVAGGAQVAVAAARLARG
jgi:hypothetical protein